MYSLEQLAAWNEPFLGLAMLFTLMEKTVARRLSFWEVVVVVEVTQNKHCNNPTKIHLSGNF